MAQRSLTHLSGTGLFRSAAIFFSLALHLAVVTFIARQPESKTSDRTENEIDTPKIFQVEIDLEKTVASKRFIPPTTRPNLPKTSSLKNFSSDFGKSHVNRIARAQDDAIATPSTDPMDQQQHSAQGWSAGVQYGNSMGLEFTLESLPFFEALHQKVNSQLVYPEDFSRQRITGKVRIEAEVSREGRLVKFRSSTSDDRLLQAYCFTFLLKALETPLQQRHWLDREAAIVVFDFDFQTRIPNQVPLRSRNGIEKNRLVFARENEVDPWLNEKIDEIVTNYVPPIVPLPGGFYVDFVRAYQMVNNLIEGTPTESEQRRSRIESLHQELKATLQRHRSVDGS